MNKKLLTGTLLAGTLFSSICFSSPVSAASTENKNAKTIATASPLKMELEKKDAVMEWNGQKRKIAYLTFDDGPNKSTPEILKTLKQNKIKATFFVLGSSLKETGGAGADILKQEVKDGHYIGLHSMTHDKKKLYDTKEPTNFINEMNELQDLVEKETGVESHLLRAPYGTAPYVKENYQQAIEKNDFKVWDWTIDSFDWKYPNNPQAVADNIKKQLNGQREVILMHDRPQTAKILPTVIELLKKEGYEFEVYNPKEHFPVNFSHNSKI